MKRTNFCEDTLPKKKVGRPPKKRIEHSPRDETRETTTPTKRARIQTSAEKSSPTLEKRLKPLITDPNQRFSCVILEDCSKRFKTVGDVEEHILTDHGELRACRLDINELLLSEYKASNEDIHGRHSRRQACHDIEATTRVQLADVWKSRGRQGQCSRTQACFSGSHSQLNTCVNSQPQERPMCSKTRTTESEPLHAVPNLQERPRRPRRRAQRCGVAKHSQ